MINRSWLLESHSPITEKTQSHERSQQKIQKVRHLLEEPMTWQNREKILELAEGVLLRTPSVDPRLLIDIQQVLFDARLFAKPVEDSKDLRKVKREAGILPDLSNSDKDSEDEEEVDVEDESDRWESRLLFRWLTGLRLFEPLAQHYEDAWTDFLLELQDLIDDMEDAKDSLGNVPRYTVNEAHVSQAIALRKKFSMTEFIKITRTFSLLSPLAHMLCLDLLHAAFGDLVCPHPLNLLVQCQILCTLDAVERRGTDWLNSLGWRPHMAEQCIQIYGSRGAKLPKFLQPEAERLGWA